MNAEPVNKPKASRKRRSRARPGAKIGRPTKATEERIQGILDHLAVGLNREQACAVNGVTETQFQEWEKRPEFPALRAHAQAVRILALLKRKHEAMENKLDWQEPAWDLERIFKGQYDNPDKVAVQLNQQINNNSLTINADELAAAR